MQNERGRPEGPAQNVDSATVAGFGYEWSRFDQAGMPADEVERVFAKYFSEFPWETLPLDAAGFDAGCGSGRWARLASLRVGTLHCIDASAEALAVARRNLADRPNCVMHLASVSDMPMPDESLDFGYSLGVLHHVPDTLAALRACQAKLKPGAPFLVYLYYAMDGRPAWFRAVWRTSNVMRQGISRLPHPLRLGVTSTIAATAYWPLARFSRWRARHGKDVSRSPLSFYRDSSFYTMRTDALDRFGTRLEKRFTRQQIEGMLREAGFERIRFREGEPFWCAVGWKPLGDTSGLKP